MAQSGSVFRTSNGDHTGTWARLGSRWVARIVFDRQNPPKQVWITRKNGSASVYKVGEQLTEPTRTGVANNVEALFAIKEKK